MQSTISGLLWSTHGQQMVNRLSTHGQQTVNRRSTQDVNELTTRARTLIFTKAGDLLKYSTDPYLTVVLDLPCSFFMIKSVRCGRPGGGLGPDASW